MAASSKVFTAPLAVIKIDGIPIGKLKDIRISETFNRSTVRGIGRLNGDESVALTWDGTLSCSAYLIDFAYSMNVLTDSGVLQRRVQTIEDFVNTVLLNENGVTFDILRKVKDTQNATNGVVTPKYEVFASVGPAFLTREGMNIAESQISGRDAEFVYLNPVIFPQ